MFAYFHVFNSWVILLVTKRLCRFHFITKWITNFNSFSTLILIVPLLNVHLLLLSSDNSRISQRDFMHWLLFWAPGYVLSAAQISFPSYSFFKSTNNSVMLGDFLCPQPALFDSRLSPKAGSIAKTNTSNKGAKCHTAFKHFSFNSVQESFLQ